jgi:hypothetical protein
MGRAILVLSSTLLFGLFGLLVGYLNVKAITLANSGSRLTDTILMSYFGLPLGGAVFGFVVSVVALMLFAPREKR